MSKNTESKVLCKQLIDSVFCRDIYLVMGDVEESERYIAKRFKAPNEIDYSMDGAFVEPGDGSYIIWLNDYFNTPEWHSILHHEVNHAVIAVLKDVGVKLSDDSEEVYSYYAGSLTRQILQIVMKDK